ncbi:hypothetical protein GCM10023222_56390 [Saccharopolyspora cebuensis]
MAAAIRSSSSSVINGAPWRVRCSGVAVRCGSDQEFSAQDGNGSTAQGHAITARDRADHPTAG